MATVKNLLIKRVHKVHLFVMSDKLVNLFLALIRIINSYLLSQNVIYSQLPTYHSIFSFHNSHMIMRSAKYG